MDRVRQGDENARRQGRTGTSPRAGRDGVDGESCPYQGLAPFEAENSELFFGRARATSDLLERLGKRLAEHGSILMVSGASGVGKSSLLRAGLLPALANDRLPVDGSGRWPRRVMTPTAAPLRALAESWTAVYGGRAATVEEQLRDHPEQALAGGDRLVLVVDQFEELFTLVSDERERQAFVRALHVLADGPVRAGVVIGVRADYWDRCAAYPQFAEAIQDGQVIVEPMTESDLRLAISGPAAAADLEIEPGLVDTVLAELRADRDVNDRYDAGALPLLSQALRNTWDRRENGRLTIRGYEESGRVRDAVQHTADEVFQRLSPADRMTALRVFRRMTVITVGRRVARRRATLAELHAAASAGTAEQRTQGRARAEQRTQGGTPERMPSGEEKVDALVSAFADRRLITVDEDTAEIAHDALLTAWRTLRDWLAPDLAAQEVYDRLIEDAGEWDEHRRDPAFLYRGARLLTVRDTQPRWERDRDSFPPPGPTVDAFVAASTQAARRIERRRRLVMATLAVLTILALLAAGAAIRAAGDADRQRAVATSRQLAAQSEIIGDTDPTTSALLAVSAWRIARTPEARYSMLNAAAHPARAVLSGHSRRLTELAFSPDGSLVVSGSEEGAIRLWDTRSHRQIAALTLEILPGLTGCGGRVSAAFSPDGKVLATACFRTVRFWDVATRRPVGGALNNKEAVQAMAYNPDGRILATGSYEGTVRLWEVATRRQHGATLGRRNDRNGNNAINAVAFSPDGKGVAAAGADHTARLWDTTTQRQIGATFTGHSDVINGLSVSPDGKTLATASADGTARLWSLTTHRQSGSAFRDPDRIHGFNGIAFSPDGTKLATAGEGGSLRIWDRASHSSVVVAIADNRLSLEEVAYSPDGKMLAAGGDDTLVRLVDPVAHQQVGATIPGVNAVALSPDGKTLATSDPRDAEATVRLWDVATQRPIGDRLRLASNSPPKVKPVVFSIKFSPDGKTLLIETSDSVQLWDIVARRQIGPPVYVKTPGDVRMAFSPDGRLFAIPHNKSIEFWAVAGRRESGPRITAPGHTDSISALTFSPDGATLATAGKDRTVRFFDVATRRQIGAPLRADSDGFLDSLAFSADGTTLATAASNNTVRLWDVAGRRQVGTALIGNTSRVIAIAFSPDGKSLVTGAMNDDVRLWDLQTHRQIGLPLTGHKNAVSEIVYSPDGTTAATQADRTVRLWNVGIPADPAATVCANAGRSFTRAEWRRYVPGEKFRQVCH
jgi:WD40 repeat protein